jgi:hypothetical protein
LVHWMFCNVREIVYSLKFIVYSLKFIVGRYMREIVYWQWSVGNVVVFYCKVEKIVQRLWGRGAAKHPTTL